MLTTKTSTPLCRALSRRHQNVNSPVDFVIGSPTRLSAQWRICVAYGKNALELSNHTAVLLQRLFDDKLRADLSIFHENDVVTGFVWWCLQQKTQLFAHADPWVISVPFLLEMLWNMCL